MTGDDLLRETLQRAARGEPPVGDAWARFQARRRRGHRARNWIVAFMGVGTAVALFLTLPSGLGTGPVTDVPAGGPFDPARRLVRLYQDPVAGFQIRYPADWFARGAPGEPVAFFVDADDANAVVADLRTREPACVEDCAPEDRITMVEVPHLFFLEIVPIPPECATPDEPCMAREGVRPMTLLAWEEQVVTMAEEAGAQVARMRGTVAGIPARRYGLVFPEQARTPPANARRPLYWCPGCSMVEYLVDWHEGWVLEIRLVAPSESSFQQRGTDAFHMVETIATYAPDDRR